MIFCRDRHILLSFYVHQHICDICTNQESDNFFVTDKRTLRLNRYIIIVIIIGVQLVGLITGHVSPRQWIRVSFAKQAAYINPGLTISQHHHRFQKQNPIGQN